MKSIIAGVILGLFVSPVSAQTFGLGGDDLIEVSAIATADTFGLNDDTLQDEVAFAVQFQRVAAAPVYETVNVTTGYETVCGPNGCEQVPIVSKVRRLVVAKTVSVPVATVSTCPCGCGLEGCMCSTASGPAAVAVATVAGPPPVGFHDHTDSAGNTWRHEHSNNGNTAAHLSPVTGELVLARSADGGGDVFRAGGVVRRAGGVVRNFRARFGFRR